jgi:hypothetical protein
MNEYYITSIEQEEASPFVIEHALSLGTLLDDKWDAEYGKYIKWYGAQTSGKIRGVLGIMICSDLPDDLVVVGIYGSPQSIKILGEYVLSLSYKNKFGYIDIKNESWMLALMKRGFEISPIIERDCAGNRIRLVQLTGGQNEG